MRQLRVIWNNSNLEGGMRMAYEMDTEYFAQHIQCTREGKQECLETVRQLVELAFAARNHGLLKMDEIIHDHIQFPDAFLRKAVGLVVEMSNPDNIRKVLYNYIFSSNYTVNQRFLRGVLITETMLATSQSEDIDYIFTYLVPSYFGMDYEAAVVDVYRNYKQSLLDAQKKAMQQEE